MAGPFKICLFISCALDHDIFSFLVIKKYLKAYSESNVLKEQFNNSYEN